MSFMSKSNSLPLLIPLSSEKVFNSFLFFQSALSTGIFLPWHDQFHFQSQVFSWQKPPETKSHIAALPQFPYFLSFFLLNFFCKLQSSIICFQTISHQITTDFQTTQRGCEVFILLFYSAVAAAAAASNIVDHSIS